MHQHAKHLHKIGVAAKLSATTNRRNIELLINRERPRITIDAPDKAPTLNPDGVSVIPYKIECLCPTAAFIEDAQAEGCIEEGLIPKFPFYIPVTLPNTIAQTTVFERHSLILEHITTEQMQRVKAKSAFVRFHGFIKYRGVHLLESEPSYIFPFDYRLVYEVNGLGHGQDSIYWERHEQKPRSWPEITTG
jgi:hypothetical protein